MQNFVDGLLRTWGLENGTEVTVWNDGDSRRIIRG